MTGEDYEARKDEHRPDWPGYASDHLPECPAYGLDYLDAPTGYKMPSCICYALRACEQRVLLSKPNIGLSAVYGYEAGLAAARDAVADMGGRMWVGKADALAAIDALRGDA